MMVTKGFIVLCCLFVAVLADEDKYTTKYDNIDLKEILANKRLFNAYVDCILDRGKCTAEGKELKDHLQEALETGCIKCSKAQEDDTATVIEHMIANERKVWDELTAKFDPTGKWRKEYEERAKAKGIVIPN